MEQYEIVSKIGNGGQGVIYDVVQNKTGIHYVMKEYDSQFLEAAREKEILSEGFSESIPFLIDYFEKEDRVYLVMEKVEGENLKQCLSRRVCFSETETLHILLQIANIIRSFHEHSPVYVYSDLKPENIMISKAGKVKIIDFGSVILPMEKGMAITGTKPYVPEDELCSLPYKDTYALGVIAYEMLTGVPFSRDMDPTRMNLHHISDAFLTVIQKAVSARRENGYANMTEMSEALLRMKKTDEEQHRKGCLKGVFGKISHHKKPYFIMDCVRLYKSGVSIFFLILILFFSAKYHGEWLQNIPGEIHFYSEKNEEKDQYGRYVLVKAP